MIVLSGISKTYGRTKALQNVSLRIDPGEFVCIQGPSGAGKSTLLHLMIGAERPTGGMVEIDGVDLRKVPPAVMSLFRRGVGMIFQDFRLFPDRTVEENIAYTLEVCGATDEAIRSRVSQMLSSMKLTEHAGSFPDQLSEGEKAKVSVARAVIHAPLVILADEPTGTLDPEQGEMILTLLEDLHKNGRTVVVTTHSPAVAERLGKRRVELRGGMIASDSGSSSVPTSQGGDETAQGTAGPDTKTDSPPEDPKKKIKIISVGS